MTIEHKEIKLSAQDRAQRTMATLRLLGNGHIDNETQVLLTWLYMIIDDIEDGKVQGSLKQSRSEVVGNVRRETITLQTNTRLD